MTLESKMIEKLEMIGKEIEGYILPKCIVDYTVMKQMILDYSVKLSQDKENIHMAFYPYAGTLIEEEAGMNASLWMLIYKDLHSKFKHPIESYLLLDLNFKTGGIIKHNGHHKFHKKMEDENYIDEVAYAFARAGVEEDWWDIDELSELPARRPDVMMAVTAGHMMKDVGEMISDIFDSDNDKEEGWFV